MSGKPTIPSKETIEFGRRVILRKIKLMDAWLNGGSPAQGIPAKPPATGAQRERIRFARFMMSRLIGAESEEDFVGCVIAPFDLRWLDDDFRTEMEHVRRAAESRETDLDSL